MMSPIDSHVPAVASVLFSPLQTPLTDTRGLELQDHMTAPENTEKKVSIQVFCTQDRQEKNEGCHNYFWKCWLPGCHAEPMALILSEYSDQEFWLISLHAREKILSPETSKKMVSNDSPHIPQYRLPIGEAISDFKC